MFDFLRNYIVVESREKWHLGATPMADKKKILQGGRWWLPSRVGRGEFCEYGLLAHSCSNYALTNFLFGLCRSIWILTHLSLTLVSILELQHALLPPKCCEFKNVPQLLFLSLFSFSNSYLSLWRSLRVHQRIYYRIA